MPSDLGVNPIHLGILMMVNMEVGLCHPPVGLNLYVGSGIAKMGISEITIAVLPWLLRHADFPGHDDLYARDFAVAATNSWSASLKVFAIVKKLGSAMNVYK